MRPWRRRRPAGNTQVPTGTPWQPPSLAPFGPTVVTLAVDRGIVNAPWGLAPTTIAHVWPDDRVPGGWARVPWPTDASGRRLIAPLDLQVGHVLEVGVADGSRWHGWVADVGPARFVLAPAPDAGAAVAAAARAFELWATSELLAVEDAWRDRLARVHGVADSP